MKRWFFINNDKKLDKKAIIFDLGGTLIKYYSKAEFPSILKQSINEVSSFLQKENHLKISEDEIWKKVKEENYESLDFRVRPMEDRLFNIFSLNKHTHSIISNKLCRLFMKPIFAISVLFKDTLPIIKNLKQREFKIAIVSNTPWGCPSNLWHEELKRFGLNEFVDVIVFCRDVGWRKPAKPIFMYTLEKLQLTAKNCIFIGDNPRWDFIGPQKIGMDAVIIDRKNVKKNSQENYISNLNEINKYLTIK